MTRKLSGFGLALVVTTLSMWTVAAAQSANAPYFGKWKLNAAKSQLAVTTVSFENAPGGMLRFSAQGLSYVFKTDGQEYPVPDGSTAAWRALSSDHWDVTYRAGGKVVATYDMTLKGNTHSVKISVKNPDGTSVDSNLEATRVSGGPGFLGVWKVSDVKPGETLLELTPTASGGVRYSDNTGMVIDARFDGKDYPATGSASGAKYTMAFRTTGARSFEMTTKVDGKPFMIDAFTVSADGRVLTGVGTPVNTPSEKYTQVLDRQ